MTALDIITLLLCGGAGLLGLQRGFVTLFSSMFLHGGVLHLLLNMWSLAIFGDNVEDRLGKLRYVLFYVASGVLAGLAQYMVDPHSPVPMVGASGAIGRRCGLIAASTLVRPDLMCAWCGAIASNINCNADPIQG